MIGSLLARSSSTYKRMGFFSWSIFSIGLKSTTWS